MGNLKLYWVLLLVPVACTNKNVPTSVQQSLSTTEIKGGIVSMFGDTGFTVNIPSIEVMQYEVTNIAFEDFVKKTGYLTAPEKSGEGMVFDSQLQKWKLTQGANWKHPEGVGSDIQKKAFHPVVQVSYDDACAYCEWINMRLPTESEWEYIFYLESKKALQESNHWQGIFPIEDKGEDGYKGTSPVGHFGKGNSNCYDLSGNVWEWCADFYQPLWPTLGKQVIDSLKYSGPLFSVQGFSTSDTLRVIKGGSFLCADNYCTGYQNKIRMSADVNLGYSHIGFRCVRKK